MSLIDNIVSMRSNIMKRVHAFKCTHIRQQISSASLKDLPKGAWDKKIKIIAKQEKNFFRYKHGQETP